jgi:hypothetical protein
MVFQRLDLPAYRAMRHMQFFGRAHQALMACSRFEYPECAERGRRRVRETMDQSVIISQRLRSEEIDFQETARPAHIAPAPRTRWRS